jgi:hypothetical protein
MRLAYADSEDRLVNGNKMEPINRSYIRINLESVPNQCTEGNSLSGTTRNISEL